MTTVLCYGDSNTYGWYAEGTLKPPSQVRRQPPEIRWTGRLQRMLGDDYRIIEEDCNGRTTIFEDPLEGWKNGLTYLRPCLYSHKPIDIVILMLGTNDLKNYFGATARQIASGAYVLIRTIRDFCTLKQGFAPEIILVAPPRVGRQIRRSPFYGEFDETAVERSYEFSGEFRRVAERLGCPFLDAADVCNADDFIDQIHLDPKAHAALAEALCSMIDK